MRRAGREVQYTAAVKGNPTGVRHRRRGRTGVGPAAAADGGGATVGRREEALASVAGGAALPTSRGGSFA